MTLDEKLDKAEAFLDEFAALVRKYVPTIETEDDYDLLLMIQDRTSVFNPYVWK